MTDTGSELKTAAAQLGHVQDVLKSIFSYYNGASGCSGASMSYQALAEPLLTSMRFQRMALDANLIGDTLTNAKVDLIFHKVCGVSPHMSVTQFFDAIVRMAATKYPALPTNEGVLRLYGEHFASFSGTTAVTGIVADLDDASLAAVGSSCGPLQTLYEGYFACECRQLGQRSSSSSQSATQSAFVKALTDFEVLPELLPKSMAFSVFREVARVRDLPVYVHEHIVGEAPVLGRNFTYLHFAVAIILVARRCFADDGATSVFRLFDWMDASKGRMVFASLYPGHVKGGTANFRIMPEKAAASLRADRRLSNLGRKRNSTGQANNKSGQSGRLAADLSVANSPSEIVGIGASPDGEISETASQVAEGQSAICGQMSPALENPCGAQIKPELRKLILQVFGHYAAIGDPLNRTNLSSQKFLRFLRDCGLVGSDTPAASKEFQFSPGSRMQSSRSSSQPSLLRTRPRNNSSPNLSLDSNRISDASNGSLVGHSGRRGTTQAAQGGPRQSLSRSSQRFSISPSKMQGSPDSGCNESGLPLRIFPVPLLTQVEADLIFVSATRKLEDLAPQREAFGTKRNSSAGLPAKRGSVTAGRRHHLTTDSVLHALQGVALRCFPATPKDALEHFGERILLPLCETLLEVKGQDVSFAAELMADPETVRLLERCQPGLEKVYIFFAHEHAGRRAHWSSESMSRFAEEFDLLSEVNQLPLQKIFRDCTHYESLVGKGLDGEMSFGSFQLALLMIAQKVHLGAHQQQQANQALDRLINLFQRLNTIAGSSGAGSAWKASEAPLIPGLPPATSGGQRSLVGSEQKGSGGSRTEKRRTSAVEMSWEFMMQGAA